MKIQAQYLCQNLYLDLYQDLFAAFDALIEWIDQNPHGQPFVVQGQEVIALRHHGEFDHELRKRSKRLAELLNHLLKTGVNLPDGYLWDTFVKTLVNNCRFEFSHHWKIERSEDQLSVLRTVKAARDDLKMLLGVIPSAEPALTPHQYELILGYVRDWADTAEKLPNPYRKLDEEEIRDVILTYLKSPMIEQATGETFNRNGKTDIMIVAQGGAIFIAECKIYNGPESVRKAIDQLLGYLTWRHTKALLLIFNRMGGRTKVAENVAQSAQAHPSVLRTEKIDDPNSTRHVFTSPDDQDREVTITIQLVEIPPKA